MTRRPILVAMPTTAPSPDAARPNPARRVAMIARDIKLVHSVFALPFALLAGAMAIPQSTEPARIGLLVALIIAAMVFARTWAMLVNRLADRRFDALNPRTSSRLFARRTMPPREGWAYAAASGTAFILITAMFWILTDNPVPIALSVPVLAWIALYSYTKRFTWLCHVFLGGALAASPVCAAAAVDPSSLASSPAIWWLALMVLCWVSGFDVIYALQDVDFDRAHHLHSIPARLGVAGAITLSRLLHLGAGASLVAVWTAEPRFEWIFALGVLATAGLLIAEHAVLARRGQAGLDLAFFTLNGIVSVVLGLTGILDLLV